MSAGGVNSKEMVIPPRPSSRRRNTIRTVDSTLATRLATLVNEQWHSAYYQQRHHNTAALTASALRHEAQALAGGEAAPIGGPAWASSIPQLWATDPEKGGFVKTCGNAFQRVS